MNINKILNNNFTKGFKKFINKGNVLNLSIAFVISQLFSKIVNSLSSDIIMPFMNLLFSSDKNDFSDLRFRITSNSNIYIYYGKFLKTVFEFLIMSFFIYIILIIVFRQNLNSEKVNIESLTKEQIILIKEIKEILKKKN
ncbi:Large-conductance mechanosensitive channel [Candidatus Phytoplasma mali]|uniref:Large-conductance mechanosensitive channel n=1 Tax=Phytoplasma mali (strain AT) TaxID=482235 RepID=B3QZY1_PHYMT|nr:large conductance mechanosensitive channel protein MscL [Candidatus Phytoplasma mali]CAP18518.1 Large-conductance mechanosensitive channel [Candidatus Phytoplasma mali]